VISILGKVVSCLAAIAITSDIAPNKLAGGKIEEICLYQPLPKVKQLHRTLAMTAKKLALSAKIICIN